MKAMKLIPSSRSRHHVCRRTGNPADACGNDHQDRAQGGRATRLTEWCAFFRGCWEC